DRPRFQTPHQLPEGIAEIPGEALNQGDWKVRCPVAVRFGIAELVRRGNSDHEVSREADTEVGDRIGGAGEDGDQRVVWRLPRERQAKSLREVLGSRNQVVPACTG